MCGSAFGSSFKRLFGGNTRDHLLRLQDKMTPIGMPNLKPQDFKGKKRKPTDPLGGYTSEFDRRTALGG